MIGPVMIVWIKDFDIHIQSIPPFLKMFIFMIIYSSGTLHCYLKVYSGGKTQKI